MEEIGMDKYSPLTKKMLDWCQTYFNSLGGYREGMFRTPEQCKLPEKALIRFVRRGDVPDPRTMEGTNWEVCKARGMRRGHDIDETERMWMLNRNGIDEIESIGDDVVLSQLQNPEDRYYMIPEFFIGYENDGKEAFIDVELGESDAIGFILPIETDTFGNLSFGIPVDAWAC